MSTATWTGWRTYSGTDPTRSLRPIAIGVVRPSSDPWTRTWFYGSRHSHNDRRKGRPSRGLLIVVCLGGGYESQWPGSEPPVWPGSETRVMTGRNPMRGVRIQHKTSFKPCHHPGGTTVKFALDFAADWDVRGGVWRYGLSLASALVKITLPGSVVLPCYDRLPNERVVELEQTGAVVVSKGIQTLHDPLKYLAESQPRRRLAIRRPLAKVLLRTRLPRRLLRRGLRGAQVLHSLFVPRDHLRGVARVATVHDLIPILLPDYPPETARRFRRLLDAIRDSGCLVVVPSNATRRDLIEHSGFAASRVRVVYHGIDHDKFSPHGPRTGEVLARYGLRPGGYFLYVGSFDRRKNLERLVEAYRVARAQSRITLPLVLAGYGGPDGLAARIGAELGPEVRHLNFVPEDDLPDLYRGAQATLLVSLYEGFGFPAIESMACGTPAFVSDRSSLPEIVGEAGLCVNPDDIQAIAKSLADLEASTELHAMLRAKGLQQAARFSWDSAARATLAIYQEAVESEGRMD